MQFRPEVARRSPVEQSVENIAVDVIQLVTKGVIGQPEIGVLTHGSKVIARQPHAIASSAWVKDVLCTLAALTRNEA